MNAPQPDSRPPLVQPGMVVDLWSGPTPQDPGVPGAEYERVIDSPLAGPTKLVTNVTHPTLTLYRPAAAGPAGVRDATAMIICPGGGYHDLYWELEGEEVAAWLVATGMVGIILKYRCPRRAGDVKGVPPRGPLLDAQRAVRLTRSRATEWGIHPGRIGMVGFSAGGHLAVATAASFGRTLYERQDGTDDLSPRPDFAVGCYSGYLKARDEDRANPEIPIPAGMPPVLLAHSTDDSVSDVENSVFMYLALKRAGAPVELHAFATGEHDFGVRRSDKLPSAWTDLCLRWLRSRGLLQDPSRR